VGSREGWTPKSFISSRNQRANLTQQSIEDFMDEEDKNFGNSLQARNIFSQENPNQKSGLGSRVVDLMASTLSINNKISIG